MEIVCYPIYVCNIIYRYWFDMSIPSIRRLRWSKGLAAIVQRILYLVHTWIDCMDCLTYLSTSSSVVLIDVIQPTAWDDVTNRNEESKHVSRGTKFVSLAAATTTRTTAYLGYI